MHIPFESLPGHSRIWIYQADRPFTSGEKEHLQKGLTDLCEQWLAHGTPLQTSFTIEFDQFIVMGVDEQSVGASGCSIDGSVHYLKSLQEKLNLNFFDRTRIAFLIDQKVIVYPLLELRSLFDSKTLTAETLSFDNTISTKVDWARRWQNPVKDSWLAKYLPQTAVVS